MNNVNVEVFNWHLRWRLPLAILVTTIYVALFFSLWPDIWLMVFVAISGAVLVLVVMKGTVICVGDEGIEMAHTWRLPWQAVKSARRRRFFGFPYVYIRRIRGFSWWLPLYGYPQPELLNALVENAPRDNPIKDLANGS